MCSARLGRRGLLGLRLERPARERAVLRVGPHGSAVPVPVEDVGGTGTLAGVAVLHRGQQLRLLRPARLGRRGLLGLRPGRRAGGRAVLGFGQSGPGPRSGRQRRALRSVEPGRRRTRLLRPAHLGGVDCWGYGPNGELGDGQLYSSSPYGSATPVQVESTDGNDVLSGVSSVTSGDDGYCARWPRAAWTAGAMASPVPSRCEGVDGNGVLSGASSVMGDSTGAYCALLTSGGVDCWGYGANGELGDGQFYSSGSDARPPRSRSKTSAGTVSSPTSRAS